MGMYSIHIYGVNISENFHDLPDEMRERFYDATWGQTHYDGGGYGQISFVGVEVPRGPKGIAVTDEVEAAARKAYEECPADVRAAVCRALGVEALPEPTFDVIEGWG